MIIIQFIAMLTMLIDHVGVVFFHNESFFRMIGRIAFPLYAYLLVLGYSRTRDVNKYTLRLLILALLSQIPFALLFNNNGLNAVASLLGSIITIRIVDHMRSNLPFQVITVFLSAFLMELFHFDYGAYGLLLVFIYRYAQKEHMLWLHLLLNLFVGLLMKGWTIQLYSLFSTMLILYFPLLFEQFKKLRIPRWLWLSFYPAHMLMLYLFRLLNH